MACCILTSTSLAQSKVIFVKKKTGQRFEHLLPQKVSCSLSDGNTVHALLDSIRTDSVYFRDIKTQVGFSKPIHECQSFRFMADRGAGATGMLAFGMVNSAALLVLGFASQASIATVVVMAPPILFTIIPLSKDARAHLYTSTGYKIQTR